MQDRVPLYPGRVKLTPVSGQENVYDMVRADQPTQDGDPLNKATLLKDATAALFGLGTDAVPDDVLNQLGGLTNYHVWKRTAKQGSDIPPKYELSELKDYVSLFEFDQGGTAAMRIYYADSVSVDETGKIKLIGEKEFEFNPENMKQYTFDSLKGKYIDVSRNSPIHATFSKSVWLITAPSGYFYSKNGFGGYVRCSQVQEVIGYPLIPAPTVADYPFSTDRYAYQEGDNAKPAGYTLGEVTTIPIKTASGDFSASIEYADSITVSDDGIASLVGESGTSVSNATTANSEALPLIKGKFIRQPKIDPQKVYYVQDGAIFSSASGSLELSNCQPVNAYPAIPASTTIEYMGQLGDKARAVTGSYVGTGRINGTCKIVFPSIPKVVYIVQRGTSGSHSGFLTPIPYFWGQDNLQMSQYSGSVWMTVTASVSGNTLSFTHQYNDLNDSQYTYDYYALC